MLCGASWQPLARAIGAKEAERLARPQYERDTIDGQWVIGAVSLGEALNLYDGSHDGGVSPERVPHVCRGRYGCAMSRNAWRLRLKCESARPGRRIKGVSR